jgi:N,N'-diacetyllegionaminate synthase
MHSVELGNRSIGPEDPCLIAVEVGLNHNGDLDLAHRMIDVAADAGVDAVKFQNFETEDFVSDRTVTYEYISQGQTVREAQYDMFKRYELPASAWSEVSEHCMERDVLFFATPTGERSLQQLVDLKVALLKNGSDYLVHLPLIRKMASTGIPTVMSTGMATGEEIDDAVQAFRDAGGQDLILLHCTSSYPTPAEDVHLRKIPELATRYGVPVGLSDHTWGTTAAVGAVALGACFLEKHFTLDKNLPGPDHRFSSDPDELAALVGAVRFLEKSLGSSQIGPTVSEAAGRRDFRLSCVAARGLVAGHVIEQDDVVFRRPGTGLPPKDVERLVGRMLRTPVEAGAVLSPDQLD